MTDSRASVLLGPGQRADTKESASFSIAAIGLSDRDKQTLAAVFSLSANRQPRLVPFVFSKGESADILVVDADNPKSVAALKAFKRVHVDKAHTPVVLFGQRQEQSLGGLYLPRPLIVTRMLALLERLVSEVFGFDPTLAFAAEDKAQDGGETMVDLRRRRQLARGVRALVVDDSLPVRVQMKMALEGVASRLDFAESAEEALEHICERTYDVAFIDVVLPGMDGYALCEQIKQSPNLCDMAVVMLTSNSSPADRIRGELAGCDTYLIKPVKRRIFENVLSQMLTHRTSNPGAGNSGADYGGFASRPSPARAQP